MGKRRLNSGILGASVANISITGLQDGVIIRLRNTELIPVNANKLKITMPPKNECICNDTAVCALFQSTA